AESDVETETVDAEVNDVDAAESDVETETVDAEVNDVDAAESDVETETVDAEVNGEDTMTEDESMENEQVSEEKLVDKESIADNQNKNGLKLVQALKLKEGKLDLLIRESVAAMLNAAHPQIHYPYSVSEIMTMTQIAIASGNYDETMNVLKKANDVGNSPLCPAYSALVTTP
ncbi:MAG: hypothetical protein ACRD94_02500, partial [Nitrosopumilaceae archaeon]